MKVERIDGRLWYLDRVEPEPGALEALLERAGDHVLVQPKVLNADRSLRWFAEWPRYLDIEGMAAAAGDRVLPLRSASLHGALIRADAPRPGPGEHPRVYTARLLREATGVLVPSAAVRLTETIGEPSLKERWAIAKSREAWTTRERLDRRLEALFSALR